MVGHTSHSRLQWLPKKGGMAVLNVHNKDDDCICWVVRAAREPQPRHNPHRTSWYPTQDGLNFIGIDTPTAISQIPQVERQKSLAINVIGWSDHTQTQQATGRHAQDQPAADRGSRKIPVRLDKKICIACSMTRANTASANTSVSVASTVTPGRICWRPKSQVARESARQLLEWRCQKRAGKS